VLGLLLAALVAYVWAARAPREREEIEADVGVLGHIPADAFFVAVLDVAALRRTPIGKRFLGEGRTVAGLGEIGALCGGDPMDAVTSLAIAVPAGRAEGFGVFAVGNPDAERLLACAERIVTERHGQPVRRRRGRFSVLADASQSLSSAELAVADGGPIILGEPSYVAASIALAPGAAGSLAQSPEHEALRALVEPGVLNATVVFSAEQRRTLIDELRVQQMHDSPFAAVVSGALSVRLGSELELHAVVRCERHDACEAVAQLIDGARKTEAEAPLAVAVGLTEPLRAIHVEAQRTAVHLRLSLPLEEAFTLAQRLIALRRLGRSIDAPVAPAAGSADPIESERIEAPIPSGSAKAPDGE
jgi:hypothetical protein